MRNMKIYPYILGILSIFMTTGCRHDEILIPSETDRIEDGSRGKGTLYLLNEGNMGSNKCTLDCYDYATGEYYRNIYAERNPGEVMELGDVGNDIGVYGSKLYIVVNCSHKVEVLDARTGIKTGKIDIPNCRFVKFDGGNAYVSSYIGNVGVDPDCPLGAVVRIDTASLKITGRVDVGYQPEEMEIIGDHLFVANSGGYRPPEYDNTVSVIDLNTFKVDYTIDAGINLCRLRKDRYNNLWVTSRGNNTDISPSLMKLENSGGRYKVTQSFPFAADNIALKGDSLLYIASASTGRPAYGVIDVTTGRELGNFITDGTEAAITRPYGLAVHPESGEIYVTDAKNYVSSGTLYAFSPSGKKLWEARTGDIPSAITFTGVSINNETGPGSQEPETDRSAYISRVYEYRPAPGQFINTMPLYEEGDSENDMLRKCEQEICGINEGLVSLGGFGGYITFGFDHLVENVEGEYDFIIWGNAIWQSEALRGGTAEPGIVYVSYDANGNGLPDDEWYELAGSEYLSETTIRNYSITYTEPSAENEENSNGLFTIPEYIFWKDNQGVTGWMPKNSFHSNSYWPRWSGASSLTFTGTRLAGNAEDLSGKGNNFILYSLPWGYADNYPNSFEAENSFDISWAMDASGKPVSLPGIHFVKVMTGLNQHCGHLGESSTEISKARDLHFP